MIFLFAGHHNKDSGAIGNGLKEADLTKELRNLVVSQFKKLGFKDYQIDDDNDTLSQVLRKISPKSTDIVFDIHFNASANPTSTGTEVLVSDVASVKSKKLAAEILTANVDVLNLKSRGLKNESESARGKLAVLNKKGLAALTEVCFITNSKDLENYEKNKVRLAEKYAKILIQFNQ